MSFIHWFTDPAQWHGTAGIPHRLLEHAELSALAVICGAVLAIPIAVILGHKGRGGLLAISIVNIGRAIPSFAIVAVALPITFRLGLGAGFWPTWLAVLALSLPPMFTQSYTAIRGADPVAVAAAKGMGFTGSGVLTKVELPLGLPLIMASVRVAAVQVVATAPLGALVGWGGLGRFIIDGLAQFDIPMVFGGAVLVALMAIATEIAFGAVERLVIPSGVRRMSRADAASRMAKAV